jgi:hypothetical protein
LASVEARLAQALVQTVWPEPQAVQIPLTQAAPVTHWLLEVQVARQAVAPQMKGVHGTLDTAGQLPAPSQVGVLTAAPALQDGEPQVVALGG